MIWRLDCEECITGSWVSITVCHPLLPFFLARILFASARFYIPQVAADILRESAYKPTSFYTHNYEYVTQGRLKVLVFVRGANICGLAVWFLFLETPKKTTS